MLSYVYFLGLCLIHALTSQVLHVTCDTGEDLWEKSATVLLKQLGMKKLNGYKYFCQIHIAIIHNMQRCTFKSSKVGSTPLVHWNWIKLPWKNVIRQEVDYLLLKTRFYLANFSFSAILSEVRNAFLFGDFERKTIMQIAGWLSWQWKPYFFFKIHICLDFKHLVMDAQFSLYEYNSIIPTHFHHGWNYHSENIPLVRRTCFLVPRDFLNKNRMQGITVQSWVNRRQHAFLSSPGVVFHPSGRKVVKNIHIFMSFQRTALFVVDSLQNISHLVMFFSYFIQWKCEIPVENRLSILPPGILYSPKCPYFIVNKHPSRLLVLGSTLLSFSLMLRIFLTCWVFSLTGN